MAKEKEYKDVLSEIKLSMWLLGVAAIFFGVVYKYVFFNIVFEINYFDYLNISDLFFDWLNTKTTMFSVVLYTLFIFIVILKKELLFTSIILSFGSIFLLVAFLIMNFSLMSLGMFIAYIVSVITVMTSKDEYSHESVINIVVGAFLILTFVIGGESKYKADSLLKNEEESLAKVVFIKDSEYKNKLESNYEFLQYLGKSSSVSFFLEKNCMDIDNESCSKFRVKIINNSDISNITFLEKIHKD